MSNHNEESWVLLGAKNGRVWMGRRRWLTVGGPVRVGFPWERVMRRFETHRDILGWVHTHPNMSAVPSLTDIATMRAWVTTLGQPLICIIIGSDGIRGYVFPDDESSGVELKAVVDCGWDVLVGVEKKSRKTKRRQHVERVCTRT